MYYRDCEGDIWRVTCRKGRQGFVFTDFRRVRHVGKVHVYSKFDELVQALRARAPRKARTGV